MKIDLYKLDISLARRCKNMSYLRESVSPSTLKKIKRGGDIRPDVMGRIARMLDVDVTEIMEGK